MRWIRASLLLLCMLFPLTATTDLRVQGLFDGRALFLLDGERFLLRDGETGPDGVRLLRATSASALVEYQGRRQELTLERGRFGGVYQAPPKPELRLTPDAQGGYFARGAINGRDVRFAVDTGATLITLSETEAERLRLPMASGVEVPVETASGRVNGRRVLLDRVQVGGLELSRVDAVVLPGDRPATVLLGMSFLRRIDMRNEGSVLVLQVR